MAEEKRKEQFVLEVEPTGSLDFVGPFEDPVEKHLTIRNPTTETMAFKVKCTDNYVFRIRPSMGLLGRGEEAVVVITTTFPETESPTENQRIVVLQAPAGYRTRAAAVWDRTQGPSPHLTMRVQINPTEKTFQSGKSDAHDDIPERPRIDSNEMTPGTGSTHRSESNITKSKLTAQSSNESDPGPSLTAIDLVTARTPSQMSAGTKEQLTDQSQPRKSATQPIEKVSDKSSSSRSSRKKQDETTGTKSGDSGATSSQ